MSTAEILDSTARAIVSECGAIADMLVAKNRRYGNSALEPVRLFSRADAIEQLRVRIDDKLSRIRSRQDDDTEDSELDLLGYLVLLRIARRQLAPALNSAGAVAAGYVVPPVQDGDDDPVVHVVPDRSIRATLTTDTALPFDDDQEELSVEDQERIYRVPDRTSRATTGPLPKIDEMCKRPDVVREAYEGVRTLPDEGPGALCGRMKR